MKKESRLAIGMIALTLAFLGASAPWSHAAIVGALVGTPCPEDAVTKAEERIVKLFGAMRASPWVYCLAAPAYGLDVSHGSTRFTVFFPAIAVIGPKGHNTEVIAHEIAHAEMSARTGPLLRTYKIPTWFDEGLAMRVDHRIAYNRQSLNEFKAKPDVLVPFLNEIASPASFFQTGEVGRLHYAFAKCVIEEWQREHGSLALNDILRKVSWFSEFPVEAFSRSEEICSAGIDG